jgi:DNA-binding beta-propeller fold protein YncE
MKRFFIAIVILVVLGAVATGIFLGVRRYLKQKPTVLGWNGRLTTIAGDGAPAIRDTGQGAQAAFSDPFGVAIALDGSVFVSDAGESNRIRKIAPDGVVTTFAGSTEGFADGPGTSAAFNSPSGIALDSSSNLYVADTSNNRIRKITRDGVVSTIAGSGGNGFADGPALAAQFDGPLGVAVDARGTIFIADTYNDRIRKLDTNGQVTTVAGGTRPGLADGAANQALFDTPSGVVATDDGVIIVADTGNDRLRKITPDGQVSTLELKGGEELRGPVGLALTHDKFLYVTELGRSRMIQITLDGEVRTIWESSGNRNDGIARLTQASGVGVSWNGDVFVADSGNYLVRRLSPEVQPPSPADDLHEDAPRLTPETLQMQSLLWPLDPQQSPHEVAATMGEVRGSYGTTDSRHHLHSGLDVFGAFGDVVRTVRNEKVTGPDSNWGFGDLGEGLRVGLISYIHIHVGRDKDGKVFADRRFIQLKGDDGKLARMRVRRGTRFKIGDALGTVNRMYHVHMNVGPPGRETNPLSLSPVGFSDTKPPTIERDGIQLLSEAGQRLVEKQNGDLVVHGRIKIVVDAFDRADMNPERRRLGLYKLGYQVLKSDGSAVPGFQPRITMLFNRLPPDRDATKLAYAAESGITVYGSASTRFLYEVTNIVRDGRAEPGFWDTSTLAPGPYTLRIFAADFSGNETLGDVKILVK